MSSETIFKSLMERAVCRVSERLDWLSLLVGASLLMFLTAGCSGPDGPVRNAVSGNVTLDGIPLSVGIIRFIPQGEKPGPGASTQIIGGVFRFSDEDGPVVASHRVEIEATEFQGFDIDDEVAFAAQAQTTGNSPLAKNPVPDIYNRASTLTAMVTDADDQTFQFDLKSNP